MNKKIILVSHGNLSNGMLHSLQMIIGENEALSSYSMLPGEHYSVVSDQVELLAKQNPNTQYIIIADLLGGSVCNGCIPLIQEPNVKLVSGMNMGLVIELLFAPSPMSDEDIDEKIKLCKEGITQISAQYIEKQNESSDDEFF
ncbi:MAG: hypothetical protein RR630_10610 [Coprobacillus sp.]